MGENSLLFMFDMGSAHSRSQNYQTLLKHITNADKSSEIYRIDAIRDYDHITVDSLEHSNTTLEEASTFFSNNSKSNYLLEIHIKLKITDELVSRGVDSEWYKFQIWTCGDEFFKNFRIDLPTHSTTFMYFGGYGSADLIEKGKNREVSLYYFQRLIYGLKLVASCEHVRSMICIPIYNLTSDRNQSPIIYYQDIRNFFRYLPTYVRIPVTPYIIMGVVNAMDNISAQMIGTGLMVYNSQSVFGNLAEFFSRLNDTFLQYRDLWRFLSDAERYELYELSKYYSPPGYEYPDPKEDGET